MTLARKDIKVCFNPEVHAAIKAICDQRGQALGEYASGVSRHGQE